MVAVKEDGEGRAYSLNHALTRHISINLLLWKVLRSHPPFHVLRLRCIEISHWADKSAVGTVNRPLQLDIYN
jgi:hypothetical protein